MAKRKRSGQTGRRVEVNGRSKADLRFFRFHHWMMKSDAFHALDPHEVRILVELYALYNGNNNGYLFLSCREAARRCNMGKNKASASFRRLIELGFIRRRADEPENYNLREANHWILTEFDFGKRTATQDFVHWRPVSKAESRPLLKTVRPQSGTILSSTNTKCTIESLIRDENSGFSDHDVPNKGHRYNHPRSGGANGCPPQDTKLQRRELHKQVEQSDMEPRSPIATSFRKRES